MNRHAFFALDFAALSARGERSGCEIFHSRTSEPSTPSALASAHTARSSAALPLVQDAYAIFTAEAAPGPPGTTSAWSGPAVSSAAMRSALVPETSRRVEPAFHGGGPRILPSPRLVQ